MNILKQIKNNAQELFFLSVLSICEIYYVLKTVFTQEHSLIFACLSVLIVLALALLIISLPRKYSVYILAVLGISLLYATVKFSEPVWLFTQDAVSSLFSAKFIHAVNPTILSFVLAAIFLIVNYLLIYTLHKNIAAAILSVGIICALYFTYDYINILFAIIYVCVVLLIFLRWSSPELSEGESKKIFLVPFMLILLAAAVVAPISVVTSQAKPDPLRWIDDIELFDEESAQPKPDYVVRIDGQSKLTNLANEFNYSDTDMLVVASPYLNRLRNKTYDTYEIIGWNKSLSDTAPNQGLQYNTEELTAILDINKIPYTKYNMDIQLAAQSQMIFAPLNSTIITEFNDTVNINPYDDIFVDEPLKEQTAYTLETLDIDYSSEQFYNFIIGSASQNIDNKENYLSIPEHLKKTLKPIAQGLTKDAQSNYEKAKIIEGYLSTQFTYTDEPPEKPGNEDFIEYFLFETKQGFCTHYASSMIMLLRSIGIPCRYVTGYILNAPTEFSYHSGVLPDEAMFTEGFPYEFRVRKQNSHAWVEVWFDDFGWLTFEPTSGYTSPLGYNLNVAYPDFDIVEIEEVTEDTKSYNLLFIILGSIIAAAILTTSIIRIVIISQRTDKKKIDILWLKIQKLYCKKKELSSQNETAREFYMRTDKHNQSLYSALIIYEYAAYSNKDIASWQLVKMKRMHKDIQAQIRNYKKLLRKDKKL